MAQGAFSGTASAGLARHHRASAFDVAEIDAALGQVVRRELQRDPVTREDADVVLFHLARRVGDQLVSVVEGHAKTGVGQHLVDDAHHVDQFFLGHSSILLCLLQSDTDRVGWRQHRGGIGPAAHSEHILHPINALGDRIVGGRIKSGSVLALPLPLAMDTCAAKRPQGKARGQAAMRYWPKLSGNISVASDVFLVVEIVVV